MTPDEFIDALERLVRSTAYEYARSTAYVERLRWSLSLMRLEIDQMEAQLSAQVSGGVAAPGVSENGETLESANDTASNRGEGSREVGKSGPEPERITLWRHGEGDTGGKLKTWIEWIQWPLSALPPDHGETLVVVPAEAYDRAVKEAGEWRKMFFDVQDRRLLRWTGTHG